MNAIKLAALADDYMDTPRAGRYYRIQYDNAFNSAIKNFIDSVLGTEQNPISNFQLNQFFNDNLYTLQKTQTAAPTSDVALYPADYRTLDSIYITIAGTQYYCRPTTQNKLGPLLENSYTKPADNNPYYLQNLTGFKLYHGTGTITSVDLNYVKSPTTFTIGKESQLITPGATVLTNGASYIAVDPSVQNAINYNIGDQFTAVGTNLTSGTVILASNTQTTDLPEKVQEQIAKSVASILTGSASDYDKSAFAEKEAAKS